MAKVLFLDIETKPLEVLSWGIHDQHHTIHQIKEEWEIICWAARWRGTKEVISAVVPVKRKKNADLKILKPLWNLMNQADVIIGHNIDSFDIPKINARMIKNDFDPTNKTRTIDTLKMARQRFKFTSNKLEYLANFLNLDVRKYMDRKFHGLDLWIEFMAGNKEAREEMIKYNKQDIVVLEAVFDKLSPWCKTIDFNIFEPSIRNTCKCGKEEFIKNGYSYPGIGKYQRYRCTGCGAESIGRDNLLSKVKRASLRK
jgi:DNA polymerase elongation subunit (family B)